jgi:hypothetical protein
VVDLDAALGQRLLDVAVRQPEPELPADPSTMTSGGKRKPATADLGAIGEQAR